MVRTTQPVEDVLEGLEEQGYEREGDLVVSDRPTTQVTYTAAAQLDDLLKQVRFEDGEAGEELLRVPYSYDGAEVRPSPPSLLLGDLPLGTFYDCE